MMINVLFDSVELELRWVWLLVVGIWEGSVVGLLVVGICEGAVEGGVEGALGDAVEGAIEGAFDGGIEGNVGFAVGGAVEGAAEGDIVCCVGIWDGDCVGGVLGSGIDMSDIVMYCHLSVLVAIVSTLSVLPPKTYNLLSIIIGADANNL